MIIFLVVLGIIVGIILLILLTPLRIIVNTWEDQYRVEFGSLARAMIIPDEEFFHIEIRIPLKTFRIDPVEQFMKKGKPGKKKKMKQKRRRVIKRPRVSFSKGGRLGIAVLRTFRLKRFNLVIDTGDFVKNARLIPVLLPLNHGNFRVGTTFTGDDGLDMLIENRLGRIVYQGFRIFVLKR